MIPRSPWDIHEGGKYYVIRNYSSIFAFVVGKHFKPETSGFCVACGHTDSPCLRIRPNHHVVNNSFLQVTVDTYGGGLWHTWFDRGLGVAGKVIIKRENVSSNVLLEEKLVRIARPIAILPNLAIHLQTAEERASVHLNKEIHLQPIIGTKYNSSNEGDGISTFSPDLLNLLSDELNCKPSEIVDLDLSFMDATESRLCGVYEEFIESPRLDNLVSTWCALYGLAEISDQLMEGNTISVAVAFDHEEIGSVSFTGANSDFFESALDRILASFESDVSFSEIISRSFLLSMDMAHSLHPNYSEKHQKEHAPLLHKGVTVKINPNQRYISHGAVNALLTQIAEKSNVPLQHFLVRNETPCGGTVGPLMASRTGIRGVDIGITQLAMHSCREMCGADDIKHLLTLVKGFYQHFREMDSRCVYLSNGVV
ncbi:aspartyl aminopeptidase [Cardiosporidium cionae]|uniref:aspartyl aminopeptidase n=1 Tax=Cardiosporidium cionae TaxID=476202 RepID=A0ABQ7J4S2_9APIC|nr:aspartyl aminopeptidase [Cardiosporidium cionae]|eukprot:KAF8819020.1 aspartyl aminopeptidase [Cardiosporidium cionae]